MAYIRYVELRMRRRNDADGLLQRSQRSKGEILITAQKEKERSIKRIGLIWLNRKLNQFIWFVLFFAGVMAIFAVHYLPDKYSIKEGHISPTTIKATQTITFADDKKTEERRRQAEEEVGEIYVLDKMVFKNMENEVDDIFDNFSLIIRNDQNDREKVKTLKKEYNLSDLAANIVLSMEPDTIRALKAETVNLLRTNWQDGVRESELDDKKTKIMDQIELLNYNAPYRELIKAIIDKVDLKANYRYDADATEKARDEAAQNVGPVLVTVQKGQKIVDEGEVVSAEQVEILQALGYQRTTSPYLALVGIGLLQVLYLVLVFLFFRLYRRDERYKENNIKLLGLLVFVLLLLTELIVSVKISSQPEVAALVGYLIPVAAISMLVTILLDARTGSFFTIVISTVVGILTDSQLSYTINAFVGGLVGVYSVSKFSQRFDWVRAGMYVAGADVVCIVAFGLMESSSWQVLLTGVFLGILNGLFSAVFAYGSLPFLESAFKLTTSVRLLELSNPNQPLLRRLLLEAPGTYHHSVLVGNLGEAAADKVGADSLLVRVGSYYHDIGKLKRPYFFIENQLGGENPHEKLTPSLSTLIITSHVKDGLELARQHGIPPVIMDLIAQHHGTSLATYFYHKALELGNADTVKESDYRYDAPKPQSKEAAIIMLADNVEAAVRSLTSVTTGKIESMVRKIIRERLQDGQLDESDLTFKDLDLIINAFTHILNGIFHTRIEYPDNVLEAMKGGTLPGGDSIREPAGSDQDN